MSEKKALDKRKILFYVIAVIVIAAVAWVILRGMNVFRYAESYDNALEQQREAEQEE